ncbi:hypothetical protein JYU34_005487 [Plutella xylostella]|uniref:Uncharacterized protein n=1 Tax=Plutella xylostella TaxID=51655 RepID=A0ABQ7QWT5_PLUXY|nr:hypothetical protein JYU34_005487 [Plutella xylostella]
MNKVTEASSCSQLYHLKCRFQALKDRCDQTTELFREANEQGNGGIIIFSLSPAGQQSKDIIK